MEVDMMGRLMEKLMRQVAHDELRRERKRVARDKTGIDLTNTMIYWSVDHVDVRLIKWPDNHNTFPDYSSWGACNVEIQRAPFEFRKAALFINAYQILLDGINPDLLHRVLMPLDEYRDGLADDRLWFYSQC